MRSGLRRFVTSVSLVSSACTGGPAGPVSTQTVCERALALRTTPAFTSVPEEADIAARVLPGGFGGLYQDIGFGLVAYFKESVSFEVKQDLASLLHCGGAYPGWEGVLVIADPTGFIVRQGQYTASELLSWLQALEPLKADPAVWGIEVDPETNRIWLGITDAAELGRLQQTAAARAVPLAAVRIEAPPPSTGLEQFGVLDPNFTPQAGDEPGTMYFWLPMQFTNRQDATRYPDWCVGGDWIGFLGSLEKWDGTEWKFVNSYVCRAVLLPPRAVEPGDAVTDTVLIGGARRLNTGPVWRTARISGTYRFVGIVYTATTPHPISGIPILANLAPREEQLSAPFRIKNVLPF